MKINIREALRNTRDGPVRVRQLMIMVGGKPVPLWRGCVYLDAKGIAAAIAEASALMADSDAYGAVCAAIGLTDATHTRASVAPVNSNTVVAAVTALQPYMRRIAWSIANNMISVMGTADTSAGTGSLQKTASRFVGVSDVNGVVYHVCVSGTSKSIALVQRVGVLYAMAIGAHPRITMMGSGIFSADAIYASAFDDGAPKHFVAAVYGGLDARRADADLNAACTPTSGLLAKITPRDCVDTTMWEVSASAATIAELEARNVPPLKAQASSPGASPVVCADAIPASGRTARVVLPCGGIVVSTAIPAPGATTENMGSLMMMCCCGATTRHEGDPEIPPQPGRRCCFNFLDISDMDEMSVDELDSLPILCDYHRALLAADDIII